MNFLIKPSLCLFLSISILSCADKHEKAQSCLNDAQSLFLLKKYDASMAKIDSIQKIDAKAFDQIKLGFSLKQEVRKAKNLQVIANCDSLLPIYQAKEDSLKKLFVFQQNKEYQEKGIFVPKETSSTVLSNNMIRSGVQQDGDLYLESVYIGSQLHNKLKISNKKIFVETLPVNDDGFNYRFNNLGKQYEIIKYNKAYDNGVAKFIAGTSLKPLTVTLEGKGSTSFQLSATAVKAIRRSYELSTLLLAKDSVLRAKDKSKILINYLEQKKDVLPK